MIIRLLVLFFILLLSSAGTAQQSHAIFTRADSLRGGIRKERTCYDLLTYDLWVAIDTTAKSISGNNTFSYIARSNFRVLQIDLFANMHITKITADGQELSFRRDCNAVFVEMPRQIKKGEQGSFTVFFSGKPHIAKNPPWDGGFIWLHDKNGNPWITVTCQGIGASLWWPCKEDLSDEPLSMQIHCTVPSSLRCISNGKEAPSTVSSDGTATFHWQVSYPINNYSVTLNIGDYRRIHDVYRSADGDTLALDYYVFPNHVEIAKKHFEQVKPMLTCFEKFLGKYPFWNDGYALVETPYLGMEHQSAIAYGNRFNTGYAGMDRSGMNLPFDYIIIHESAHEWWGNSVSAKDAADTWIHESFCTYSESIYVECLLGYDTAMTYVNALKNSVSNTQPMIGIYGVNREGHADMYVKGMLFLNTIRHVIADDSRWWRMIKTMSDTTFKLKNIEYTEVVRYFNRQSGMNLSRIFDLYVRHAAIPEFQYKWKKRTAGYTLYYRWKADVRRFNMPLDVFISGKKIRLFPALHWKQKTFLISAPTDFSVDERGFYVAVKTVD